MTNIPFNKPYMTGKELWYISQAHHNAQLSGDGPFTKKCHKILEVYSGAKKVLLTHSCTAALEMAAILTDIQPGDEIIMPSYTFVSTANAFVLRGGVPVFVDVRPDTLNIDETKIEAAITEKTKAIVPVHYAGVACEMDEIMRIAGKHGLIVIEDAAQGICSSYKGKALGAIGDLGTFSFHETKNITSGEGGALLINNDKFLERAEIIREKGTNRSKFLRGQVDKYTWVDMGSSFLPGEVVAAFLLAQLENMEAITNERIAKWNYYKKSLKNLVERGKIRFLSIPENINHNAHLFGIITNSSAERNDLMDFLNHRGIKAVFHYIPLHTSAYGKNHTKISGSMANTEDLFQRLTRLPLFTEISNDEIDLVVSSIYEYFDHLQK